MVSTRPGLAELEAEFAEAPLKVRKALQLWKTDDYPQFLAESAAYLKATEDSPFTKLLLSTLRGDGRSLQELLLKDKPLEADEALRVLSLAAKADPSYPVALLGILRAEAERQSGLYSARELVRLLELLQSVVDMNALLPVLTPLCQHPDKQLRSKAVLLAAGPGRKAQMKVDGLGDLDHRVRANAVQALWGESDEEAIGVFLSALSDSHHRVVGNGLYGLYRAGSPMALSRIPAMMRQGDPNRQMAAAWVMGKSADPRFLGCIETMLPVSSGRTRSNLLHAARAIEERKRRLQSLAPLEVTVVSTERGRQGRVSCAFIAKLNDGERLGPEELRANDVLISDGGMRVDAVRLEPRGSGDSSHVVLLLPARNGVDDPYAVKLIESAEEALRGKRPHDNWAVLKYEAVWDAPEEAGFSATIPVEFSTNAESIRSGTLRATKLSAKSLQAAMEQACLSFPQEAKHKVVLLVRDRSLDNAPKLSSTWKEAALAAGVEMYCLFGNHVDGEEAAAWRNFAREADGLALQCSSDSELPKCLKLLVEASQGSFFLTYALARLGSGGIVESKEPVQIDIYSDKGQASLRILEE